MKLWKNTFLHFVHLNFLVLQLTTRTYRSGLVPSVNSFTHPYRSKNTIVPQFNANQPIVVLLAKVKTKIAISHCSRQMRKVNDLSCLKMECKAIFMNLPFPKKFAFFSNQNKRKTLWMRAVQNVWANQLHFESHCQMRPTGKTPSRGTNFSNEKYGRP